MWQSCPRNAVLAAVFGLLLIGSASAATTSQPASQPGADSPRALLEKLDHSFRAMDVDVVAGCVVPELQDSIRQMMAAERTLRTKTKSTRQAVVDKFGKEVAGRVLPADRFELDSPLHRAVKDGKVNWELIKITETGDEAAVEIDGDAEKDLAMKRVEGRWYAAPPGLTADKVKEMLADGLKDMGDRAKAFDEFEKKVKSGAVTEKNIDEEFEKCMKTADEPAASGKIEIDPGTP
jgi:hypothetical protein